VTRQEQTEWIARWAPAARAANKKWGVPTPVTLAQAIIESSDDKGHWGFSGCALKAKNYFGLKVDHDGEAYVEFPTKEFDRKDGHPYLESGAKFRSFADPAESFDAHAELIATARRYRPAMAAAHDPVAFAAQLQVCGYSTNPKYAKDLTWLIQHFNLTQYDTLPPDPVAEKEQAV